MSDNTKKKELTKSEKRGFTVKLQKINSLTKFIDESEISDATMTKLTTVLDDTISKIEAIKKEG